MSNMKVAIATPIDAKSESAEKDPNANISQSQVKFAVSDGLSFEDQAGFFGRWFLLYLDPLFKLGSERTLLHSDLGFINKKDQCKNVQIIFDKYWEIEQKKPLKKQSLWMVLWKTAGLCNVGLAVFYYSLYAGISYGPILILNSLVKHFQGTQLLPPAILWFQVALIFALPMAGSLYASMSNIILAHVSVQFRNVLVNKIYRKAMVLSPAARQKSSTGQIITMFSNDTKQIQSFLFFLNNILVAPAQIIVALALIYQQVGTATFVGLGFMFFLIPLNGYIFSLLQQIRRKKVKVTDTRVKLMNEILSGVRVLKYYAWERAFSEKVEIVREEELQLLKQLAYVVAIGFTLVLMSAPIVQPILIFFTYIQLGNTLDAATAFTTISLFNVMQFPFAFLPMGIAQYSQSLVSTKRMLDFFNAEELTEYVDKKEDTDGTVVGMTDCSMCWIVEEAEVDTSKFTPAELKVKEKEDKKKLAEKTLKEKTDKLEKEKKDAKLKAKRGIKDSALTISEVGKNAEEDRAQDEKDIKQIKDIENAEDTINRSCYTLEKVSFSVKKGQLLAVVGSVGSGKSSVLSGLLGEMNLQSGKVRVSGSVAYCDQRPWILNTTVRDNILFGQEYDEKRFDRTLHAANLEDDIKVLPGGILTEIGERGINLSGGQKARVALARAIYRDADIYLLDDPLSAVDAHVGQHIFHECILGALAGKTRVLVTHHVHLLHLCDLVLVIENGAVKAFGTYDELRVSGVDIDAFVTRATPEEISAMNEIAKEKENQPLPHAHDVEGDVIPPMTYVIDPIHLGENGELLMNDKIDESIGLDIDSQAETAEEDDHTESKSILTDSALEEESKDAENQEWPDDKLKTIKDEETLTTELTDAPVTTDTSAPTTPAALTSVGDYKLNDEAQKLAGERKKDDRDGTKITSVEEKNEGDVKWSTYSYYIRAGGWFKFIGVIFFLLMGQLLAIISSFVLALWGDRSTRATRKGEPLTSAQNMDNLNYFALYSMMGVVGLTLRALVLAQHRLGTSSKLHKFLLDATLGAPIAFFDVTPIGRILNRFSSDMVVVDEELSQTISQLTNSLFSCIGAVGAIAGATKGTFLALCLPLIFLYERIQRYFRKSNTAIARNQSVSLSPIYADFSQALTGLSSIRAYGETGRFVSTLENRVDYNTIASVMSQLAAQWLAIRLDFIGSLISFFIAVVAVSTNGFLPASSLALGLTYSFQMTTYLKFAVRMLATGEAQMNAVERIMYYIDNIDKEDDGTKKDANGKNFTIPDTWPSVGAIEGKGVSMRYRDGPLVLKNVDFSINGSEKIGIAGRTGSGKSSMMISLFRIQESCEGQILIDGIDTSTVPLHILRSRLGIIPQDPVIFSASVRFNLDPFDEHSDAAIWDALSSVDMKDHVMSLTGKLSEEVAEGGDNFSTGQRQLVCIARALLRKPKILVLDEATASIDNETDELIQKMVRENFKDCTVLTIAHRLHTIIDSDRIIVLDSGVIAEFDSPANLLSKDGGDFKSLWDRHQKSHEGGGSSRGSKTDLAGMVESTETHL